MRLAARAFVLLVSGVFIGWTLLVLPWWVWPAVLAAIGFGALAEWAFGGGD